MIKRGVKLFNDKNYKISSTIEYNRTELDQIDSSQSKKIIRIPS